MKTTVEIEDNLLKAAKKAAIDEGVPLRHLIEMALRDLLSGRGRVAGDLDGAFQILDDLEAAARDYQEHLREKAS